MVQIFQGYAVILRGFTGKDWKTFKLPEQTSFLNQIFRDWNAGHIWVIYIFCFGEDPQPMVGKAKAVCVFFFFLVLGCFR